MKPLIIQPRSGTPRRSFLGLLAGALFLPAWLGRDDSPLPAPRGTTPAPPPRTSAGCPPQHEPATGFHRHDAAAHPRLTLPTPDPSWHARPRIPILVADDPDMRLLLDAIRLEVSVRFQYEGGSDPDAARTVAPASLFTVAGCPGLHYFSAFCFRRRANRTFRLDRVRNLRLEILGIPFRMDSEHLAAWFS